MRSQKLTFYHKKDNLVGNFNYIYRNRESGKRQGAISGTNSFLTHSPSSRSREDKKMENIDGDRNKRKGIFKFVDYLVIETQVMLSFFSSSVLSVWCDFHHLLNSFLFPFYRRKSYRKLCKQQILRESQFLIYRYIQL